MKQISTCTFFKVKGISNKWWAFKQMIQGKLALKEVRGLSFF